MQIFVTGASGFIGSAVVTDLIRGGHQVVGLARSDESAAAVEAAGAVVLRGTLDDLDQLRAGASGADGVIHLAFKHDEAFTGNFDGAAEADRLAIDALGSSLLDSGRPLVIAAGTAALPAGRVGTEDDAPDPDHPLRARLAGVDAALSFAAKGVRTSVVRLAPTVHGEGDHGFLAILVAIARAKGSAGYLGDGTNRWPAVHRLDAAHLFRLAVEKAPAGSILHGVDDQGVALRTVADVIGRHLDVPVVAIGDDDAAEHFGWLAGLLAADLPASSALTRERLEWAPTGPGLIDDLDEGHYFSGR